MAVLFLSSFPGKTPKAAEARVWLMHVNSPALRTSCMRHLNEETSWVRKF